VPPFGVDDLDVFKNSFWGSIWLGLIRTIGRSGFWFVLGLGVCER